MTGGANALEELNLTLENFSVDSRAASYARQVKDLLDSIIQHPSKEHLRCDALIALRMHLSELNNSCISPDCALVTLQPDCRYLCHLQNTVFSAMSAMPRLSTSLSTPAYLV